MRPSPISTSHMQNLFSHVVPTPTYQPPTTITPADSDEDVTPSQQDLKPLAFTPSHIRHTNLIDVDQDTPTEDHDMADPGPLMSPPSFIVSPPTGSRLPTPIVGSFFSRMQSMSTMSVDNHEEMMNTSAQYRLLEQRKLPSPISEAEDGLLSPMAGPGGMMDRLVVGRDEDEMNDDHGPPADGERVRRGRSRSRRADGKDRVDEGRPTLSMGFRADCEKCQARIPGHYSHVVRA
ncbi:MAG: hypothetical protein M1817_002948 [Caeruleum heppii]|nr:MAG: hypothetical protein M1817_002948 [Caeruleum heppii]